MKWLQFINNDGLVELINTENVLKFTAGSTENTTVITPIIGEAYTVNLNIELFSTHINYINITTDTLGNNF